MHKSLIIIIILASLVLSCNGFIDRVFEYRNNSDYAVRISAYSNNQRIYSSSLSQQPGIIINVSASFDPEIETIATFVGDSINIIFEDSLVLKHYSSFKNGWEISPPFEENLIFSDIWTKVSDEYWTFEVTDEMYKEAVPLED